MDAIFIIIILLLVIVAYHKLSKFAYALAIIDILLRILNFIKLNLGVLEIKTFISKYFPSDIPSLIYKYTDGALSDILVWGYVIIFIVFLFYIIRAFVRNKKL